MAELWLVMRDSSLKLMVDGTSTKNTSFASMMDVIFKVIVAMVV